MRLLQNIVAVSLFALSSAGLSQHVIVNLPETGKAVSIQFTPSAKDSSLIVAFDVRTASRTFHFVPKNSIETIPIEPEAQRNGGLPAKHAGMTLDRSRVFFRGEYLANGTTHTLLFFVNGGFASNASPLFVLGFKTDGTPYKVLERDELDIVALLRPASGGALIIGKPSLSEIICCSDNFDSKSVYATTYDPYAAYVVEPDSPAKFSPSDTETYNRANYVWAGLRFSNHYAVIYNLPGRHHPLGVPEDKVEETIKRYRASKQ